MSQSNGDRSRSHRVRKAKIARRLRWREVAKPAAEPVSAKPVAKAS